MSSIAQPVPQRSSWISHWKLSFPILAQISFVIFLISGDIKGDPRLGWLPFDLTVVAGALTAALTLTVLLKGKVARTSFFWMAALFLSMAIPLLWSPGTEYGVDKAARFFSLTAICAFAPAVLIRRPSDLSRLFGGLALFGLVAAADALIQMQSNAGHLIRVASGSGNTISLARDVGVSLLWAYSAFFGAGARKALICLSCVPLILVLIATGSRGPLVFSILLLGFLTLRFSLASTKTVALSLAMFLGAILATTQLISLLPSQSVNRILALVEQQQDTSTNERVYAAHAALDQIPDHPLGTGFGGFAFTTTNSAIDQPHNIFLEIALENGWLALLLFTLICGLSLARSYHLARTRQAVYLFPVLAFAIGNAAVSGGLNDNRLMFCLLCVGLQAKSLYRAEQQMEAGQA
ncbi:MAG: O-antigen ligase family protein [Candidatus Angelobacter sp.]